MLRAAVLAAVVATAASATLPESAQLTAAAARQPTLDAALVGSAGTPPLSLSMRLVTDCVSCPLFIAHESPAMMDAADACSFHD